MTVQTNLCQNNRTKDYLYMYTLCSELVIFMYWTRNSMNNLSSYCGLVDAKIRTFDKDLPVFWFCRNFILIKLGISFKLTLSKFYPKIIWIYLDRVRLRSRWNMDWRTWTGLWKSRQRGTLVNMIKSSLYANYTAPCIFWLSK